MVAASRTYFQVFFQFLAILNRAAFAALVHKPFRYFTFWTFSSFLTFATKRTLGRYGGVLPFFLEYIFEHNYTSPAVDLMAATCSPLHVATSSTCCGKPLTTHTLPWALSSIHNKKSAGIRQGSAASVSTIDVTCNNRKIVALMIKSVLVGSLGAIWSVLVLTKKKEGQQHTIHASRFLFPLPRSVPYVPLVLLHLPRHV